MADENPLRRVPWATILLILTCCAVYFAVQPGQRTLDQILNPSRRERTTRRSCASSSTTPRSRARSPRAAPLTNREFRDTYGFGETSSCNHGDDQSGPHDAGQVACTSRCSLSLFLHGSPQHLFGNMLFLWVFGNNIEDRQGLAALPRALSRWRASSRPSRTS